MFNSIKKYLRDINRIELERTSEYLRGQSDASTSFIEQQKKLTIQIQELSNSNVATEKRIRLESEDRIKNIENNANHRIKNLENIFNSRCVSCKNSVEQERIRLIQKQNNLAEKLDKTESLIKKIFSSLENVAEKQENILRSSSAIIASRDIFGVYRKELFEIISSSDSLLSLEMIDTAVVVENKVNELLKEKEVIKDQPEIVVAPEETRTVEVK